MNHYEPLVSLFIIVTREPLQSQRVAAEMLSIPVENKNFPQPWMASHVTNPFTPLLPYNRITATSDTTPPSPHPHTPTDNTHTIITHCICHRNPRTHQRSTHHPTMCPNQATRTGIGPRRHANQAQTSADNQKR